MGVLTVLQGVVSEGHQVECVVGPNRTGEFGRACVLGQIAEQSTGRGHVLRPGGIFVPPTAFLQKLVPKIIGCGGLDGTPF